MDSKGGSAPRVTLKEKPPLPTVGVSKSLPARRCLRCRRARLRIHTVSWSAFTARGSAPFTRWPTIYLTLTAPLRAEAQSG